MTADPSVLFVCVHNAGRSQMAAGFLAHLGETGDWMTRPVWASTRYARSETRSSGAYTS